MGRVDGQATLERGEHAVAAFQQQDADATVSQLRVLVRDDESHELGERAGVLHTSRSRTDDAERQERPALGLVVGRGRLLEAREHVVAELERLGQILESERVPLDRGVAVVVGRAPRRQHARVVREHLAARERRPAPGVVERDDRVLPVADVRGAAEHLADGRGDLGRVQQATRHLVQQRGEEVVVTRIDQGDVDGTAAQRLRALQPTESGADDQDVGCPIGVHALASPSGRDAGVTWSSSRRDVGASSSAG